MDSSTFSNPTSCVSALLPNTTATKKEKKNNKKMKLSTDPQSVAARQRRHRISDRFKILRSLVPGGLKMDTVPMLEEAIRYVKFLKAQILLHQQAMIGLVEFNADFHDDPAASFSPTNDIICSAVPIQHENVDLCDEYSGEQAVQGETQLGWAVSWFSGAENVPNY
ncbi:hypothetical protein OROGR_029421 [Orobanche gracilis]